MAFSEHCLHLVCASGSCQDYMRGSYVFFLETITTIIIIIIIVIIIIIIINVFSRLPMGAVYTVAVFSIADSKK